jgi:NRPS condensation-like uncharacterized protein
VTVVDSSEVYERELVLERLMFRPPHNVLKMIVKFEDKINHDDLRIAIKKVSKKHPLMRSRIVVRKDGSAYYTTEGVPEVELKIVQKLSEDYYVDIIDEENKTPFRMDTGPFARFILLESDSDSDLLLYAHHIFCDGRSLVYIVRHLMEFLVNPDKEVEVIEPVSYYEDIKDMAKLGRIKSWFLNRINSKWEKRRIIIGEELHQEAAQEWFEELDGFLHLGFTEEQTKTLRDRCREEGVSINTALLVALKTAKQKIPEFKSRPDGVAFTVDIRDMLPTDPGEACGIYASGFNIEQKLKENLSFWENARLMHDEAHEKLNDGKSLVETRALSAILDGSLLDAVMLSVVGKCDDSFVAKFTDKFRRDDEIGILLTNLGGLQIPRVYGPYNLKDVIFGTPISLGGVPTVAASGILGKMDITFPFHSTLLSKELAQQFRDTVESILLEAIKE